MAPRPNIDLTALDPDDLAFHQLVTFAYEAPPLAEHLERSPSFTVRHFDRADLVRADLPRAEIVDARP